MTFQRTTPGGKLMDSKPLLVILALYIVIVLPLCFLGYGSDNDTYQVLDAGRFTWTHHALTTSRIPGYWLYEAIVFLLNRAGGSVAVNLGSFTMGALILWRFNKFRERIPSAAVSTSCCLLILTPVFEISASSGDDYLWSALCLLLAFEGFSDGNPLRAGLWGALAIALRESNILVFAGIYICAGLNLWRNSPKAVRESAIRKILLAGAMSLCGVLPCYFSYRVSGNSFSFLHQAAGNPQFWTLKMRAGRFGYKLLLLFGPLSMVALAASLTRLPRRINEAPGFRTVQTLCLGGVAANLVLFWLFPHEIGYLLPGAICLLLMLAFKIPPHDGRLAAALICCFAFSDVVTVVVARPNQANQATSAAFTFAIEAGPLLQDIRARRRLIACDTFACWKDKNGR